MCDRCRCVCGDACRALTALTGRHPALLLTLPPWYLNPTPHPTPRLSHGWLLCTVAIVVAGSGAPKAPEASCGGCGITGAHVKLVCSKCKVAQFCNKDCFKKAWLGSHKKQCKLTVLGLDRKDFAARLTLDEYFGAVPYGMFYDRTLEANEQSVARLMHLIATDNVIGTLGSCAARYPPLRRLPQLWQLCRHQFRQ